MLPISKSIHTFVEAKKLMRDFINAYVPNGKVQRIEVRIHPIDQLRWLSAQTATIKVFGSNQDKSASIVGVGAAVDLLFDAKASYSKVFKKLRSYLNPQYNYLQWYGGFAFDKRAQTSMWSGFGRGHFVIPQFELARNGDHMIFCLNIHGKILKSKLLKTLAALVEKSSEKGHKEGHFTRQDIPSYGVFCRNVESVLVKISKDRYEKIVLARRTDLDFRNNLNPWAICQALQKVAPNSYHFAFQFKDKVFLGASPERLYKRVGQAIQSEALAGTMPVSKDPKELLRSTKNLFEHKIVVDAIGRSLSQLCVNFKSDSKPNVRLLSNGAHLLTTFEGHLKDSIRDEHIIQSLHPTPALAGHPRSIVLREIANKEGFDRGWYAGPIGYVGLDWVEFVMGIRSGLVDGKRLSIFAGAGIVNGSTPRNEWDEIEQKISNFIKVIKKIRS